MRTAGDTVFILIDLDNVGYEIVRLISENSIEEVKHLSNSITNLLSNIRISLSREYGEKLEIIYETGDNMLFLIRNCNNIEKTALEIAEIVDKEISKIDVRYQIQASIGTSDELRYVPIAISIAKLSIKELSKKIGEKTSISIVTSNSHIEIIKEQFVKHLINALKVDIEKIPTIDTTLEIGQIYVLSKILRLLHKINKESIENMIIRNVI
ncbi:MAG: hypothetical protein GXO10_00300 [Crenarchaeota archaeon]|nr:hypothetical protein [Thermoproteota archaeon]